MGPVGMGPVGIGAVSTGAVGTGAVGTGAVGTGAVGIGAVGIGAVGTGAVGVGAVGIGRPSVVPPAMHDTAPLPGTRRWAAQAALIAKRRRGLTWDDVAAALGRSVVWATSAVLGQQPLDATQAEALAGLLDLDESVAEAFQAPPVRGAGAVDRTEPVVYRLDEAIQVYGAAVAELIRERFGDGIMSAIDFEIHMDRREDPKGDRVVLTLDGKFLPYRVF
jgi:cyanate lyase